MNRNESKYFATAAKMDRAFLALLEQKDFAYITVKEICEKAEVNRSTFYLHYETIDDLLSESVTYMNEQFRAYMKQDAAAVAADDPARPLSELNFITPEYLVPYLSYVREFRALFQAALRNAKLLRLDQEYEKMFRSTLTPILERYQIPPDRRKYLMTFYMQGLMAVISQWLRDDCRESVDHMSDIIQNCVLSKGL